MRTITEKLAGFSKNYDLLGTSKRISDDYGVEVSFADGGELVGAEGVGVSVDCLRNHVFPDFERLVQPSSAFSFGQAHFQTGLFLQLTLAFCDVAFSLYDELGRARAAKKFARNALYPCPACLDGEFPFDGFGVEKGKF